MLEGMGCDCMAMRYCARRDGEVIVAAAAVAAVVDPFCLCRGAECETRSWCWDVAPQSMGTSERRANLTRTLHAHDDDGNDDVCAGDEVIAGVFVV